MPQIDDLNALLDELNAATAPSTALDHKLHAIVHGWSLPLTGAAIADFDRAADGGHLNRYTRYIDAAVQLAGQALPGWWWSCGHCKLSNDADVWVPGASMYTLKEERHGPGVGATTAPDFRRGGEAEKLLEHPTMGATFDAGFTIDRIGGTVAMALLEVMLQGMIALEETKALDASGVSVKAIEDPAEA